ncbi:MAG: hypothetical protein JW861_02050 [Bacteroidales bacterium]|nr:hypothetical protein [Bacteroidales bacterium]
MTEFNEKIVIIGAGSIGTALGNILAKKLNGNVMLLSIEEDVVQSINEKRNNFRYFPNIKLSKFLKASADPAVLNGAHIVFLCIPSLVTVDYVAGIRQHIPGEAILLNLAKGFSRDRRTITESLSEILPNPVCSFKGPTFARELIGKMPTAFTLGSWVEAHEKLFSGLFSGTPVQIDFTTDVHGVEILSILKNIYAIGTGIIDAQYDSSNLRFLYLTKAFAEMRDILIQYGGSQETMFRYCGYGDFSLTALNDLSRNRTLGLLIGKGFFREEISDQVLLEGKIAVNIFCEEITRDGKMNSHYPIIAELYKVFHGGYNISSFIPNILKQDESL